MDICIIICVEVHPPMRILQKKLTAHSFFSMLRNVTIVAKILFFLYQNYCKLSCNPFLQLAISVSHIKETYEDVLFEINNVFNTLW